MTNTSQTFSKKRSRTELALAILTAAYLTGCGGSSGNSKPPLTPSSSSVISTPVASSSVTQSSVAESSLNSNSSFSSHSSLAESSSTQSSDVSSGPQLVIAIDSGNFGTATYQNITYQADRFFTGGSANSTQDAITNSNGEPQLFQTERYGSYSYEVPVTPATYSVILHFVELYQTAAGKRSFDVLIEDQATEITQFDLFATAGHDTAYSVTVDNVVVSDGFLSIKTISHLDNATLAGFAVYSTDGEFIEPPPPPPPAPPKPGIASPENLGADCELGDFPEATTNTKLPDPFARYDGTRITQQEQWRCQRQATLRLAEYAIYGEKPPKPESVTASLSGNKITVTVQHNNKTASFTADIIRPAGSTGALPAIIGISGWGSGGLPVAIGAEEQVATITLNPYQIGAESSASRNNKQGAFYSLYGSDSTTGLLVAWSWGVSRLIDALEQLQQEASTALVDPDNLAVFGCSRFGKAAFTIGAFDQRIKLTLPLESGSGGVPIWRNLNAEGAQSPTSAYGETYWLGDAFGPYTGKVNNLPVDSHQVIGLIAPRGLLIMDNPHIANLGPTSAHIAALAGAEIYTALGARNNISYHSNVVSGTHCELRSEHVAPIKNHLRKFLKGETANTGTIDAHVNTTGSLTEWVNWDTPDLTSPY